MKKSLIKAQSATALAIILAGTATTAAPSIASVLADQGLVVRAEETGSTGAAATTDAKPAVETNTATVAPLEVRQFTTNSFDFAEDGKTVDVVATVTGDKHLVIKSIDLVDSAGAVVSSVYYANDNSAKVNETKDVTMINAKLTTKAAKDLKLRVSYTDEGLEGKSASIVVGFVTPNGMTGSGAKVFNSAAKEEDLAKALIDSLKKDQKQSPAKEAADKAKKDEKALPKTEAVKSVFQDVFPEFKAQALEDAVVTANKAAKGYEDARKTFDVPATAAEAEKAAATAIADLKAAVEAKDATVDSIKAAYDKAAEAVKAFDAKLTDAATHKAAATNLAEAIKSATKFTELDREMKNVSATDKATIATTLAGVKAEVVKAEALAAKKDATSDELNKAAETLNKAVKDADAKIMALIKNADLATYKAELKKEVEAAKALLNDKAELANVKPEDKAKYDAAKAKVTELVAKVEAFLAKEDAAPSDARIFLKDLTAANKEFKAISDELKAQPSTVKEDKELLQKLITDAEALKDAKYDLSKLDEAGKAKFTAAQEDLAKAITAAKEAIANETVTSKQVEDAHTALKEKVEAFKKVADELGVKVADTANEEPKQAAAVTDGKSSKSDKVPLKEGGKYANTGEASGVVAAATGFLGLTGTVAGAFLKRRNF